MIYQAKRAFIHPPAITTGRGATASFQMPENIPDPLLITSVQPTVQGSPWASNVAVGNFSVGIDKGGKFTELSDFPQSESAPFDHLAGVFLLEIGAGKTKNPEPTHWDPPLRYSRSEGDLWYVAAYSPRDSSTGAIIPDPFVLTYNLGFVVDADYEYPPLENMVDFYTHFLLGDDGSGFIDRSFMGHESPRAVSLNGNASLSTAWNPYNTMSHASVLCAGGSDGLVMADSIDFEPGASEFTWDLWFRCDDTAPLQTLVSKRDGGSTAIPIHITIDNGRLYASVHGIVNLHDCGPVEQGKTYYFMLARNKDIFRCFLHDGTSCNATGWTASAGALVSTNNAPVTIGHQSLGFGFYGHITGVRYSRQIPRWREPGTPPTEPQV